MTAVFRGALRPPSITPEAWEAMSDERRRNTVPEMWRYLTESSDPSDRERLLSVLVTSNMLEGLAGMYNRGLLDRGIVKTALESEARDLWESFSKWLAVVQPKLGGQSVMAKSELALIGFLFLRTSSQIALRESAAW